MALSHREMAIEYKYFAQTLDTINNHHHVFTHKDIEKMAQDYRRKYEICMSYDSKNPTTDEYNGMNAKLLYEDNCKLVKENQRLKDGFFTMKKIVEEKIPQIILSYKVIESKFKRLSQCL